MEWFLNDFFPYKYSLLPITNDEDENNKKLEAYQKVAAISGINELKFYGCIDKTFNSHDFEENEIIFRNNNSTVKKSLYKPLRYEMALKYVPIRLNSKNVEDTDLDKIAREIEICKGLTNHENIVRIYGFGLEPPNFIICMELMDMSLEDLYKSWHKECGFFPELLIGCVGVSAINAMIALKNLNVIHRDIKPRNILINSTGEIKLCDFGESRTLIDSLATTFVGTLSYLPPERFNFETNNYDVRSDIWSLGITLMEILLGELPFESGSLAILINAISSLTQDGLRSRLERLKCGLTVKTKDLILVCLEELEKRPKFGQLVLMEFFQHYSKFANDRCVSWLLEQKQLELICYNHEWWEARLDVMGGLSYDYIFKIVVLGIAKVGKSTFIQSYAEPNCSNGHTMDKYWMKTIQVNGKRIKLQIFETNTNDNNDSDIGRYIRMAHGIILSYDITNLVSFNEINSKLMSFVQKYSNNLTLKRLVGLKYDLHKHRCVPKDTILDYASSLGLNSIEVSAVNNNNVEETFVSLAQELLLKFEDWTIPSPQEWTNP